MIRCWIVALDKPTLESRWSAFAAFGLVRSRSSPIQAAIMSARNWSGFAPTAPQKRRGVHQ
jgi:hypothetical protein